MVYTCVGFIMALAVVRVVGGVRRWLCGGREGMSLLLLLGAAGRSLGERAAGLVVCSTGACLRIYFVRVWPPRHLFIDGLSPHKLV